MMANFSLNYDFAGGAPCGSGASRLSVTSSRGSFILIDELLGEGPEFRRRGDVSVPQGWRGVASYLIHNSIVAYDNGGDTAGEYPRPHLMDMKGRESIATDMIAMAWSGEPVSHIGRVLALHDDATLEALRRRHGSLRSEAFIDAMMRVKRWCDDLGADFDDIIARGPRFNFDFRLMRRDAVAMARVVAAADKATKLRQEWSLALFQPRIAAIVAAWRRANLATSGNTQIGVGMRSGILNRALEAHVSKCGCLPVGVLCIPNDSHYHILDFTVDIDALDLVSASRDGVRRIGGQSNRGGES